MRTTGRPPAQGPRSLAAFAVSMRGKYKEKVSNDPEAEVVSTGCFALDRALRVGGWQRGRIYEILGPPDSAKTSLVITSMAVFQRDFPEMGVAYVDMEHTFDDARATAMGLDCSDEALESGRWAHLFPEHSEEASNMARDYAQSGFYSVVVVDSIGAMESKKVLDKDAERDTMGANAKTITQMTKALSGYAHRTLCTVLLVNQPRASLSLFGGTVSAGPMLMKHATTAKVQMQSLGDEDEVRKLRLSGDDDPTVVSQMFQARVTRMKNGTAGGRVARFWVNKGATEEYGPPGIDAADDYLTFATSRRIVRTSGSWLVFPDGHKSQGRVAATRYLREHPEIVGQIREASEFDAPAGPMDEQETA